MFCFVSKSAWVIPPPEFAIFVSILSPSIFKLEQSIVAQLKFVKKFIISCLRSIAELVAEKTLLTFRYPQKYHNTSNHPQRLYYLMLILYLHLMQRLHQFYLVFYSVHYLHIFLKQVCLVNLLQLVIQPF